MVLCKRFPTALILVGLLLIVGAAPALADPCLVVYPTGACTYHYDVNEYYVVGPGDPLYDPAYDRGGVVLIDSNTNEIAYNIYQAPGLTGFTVSSGGQDGYFFEGNSFQLVVDGFNNAPITYTNIYLVAVPLPESCPPNIMINGSPMTGSQLLLGDLTVSTPTAEGNNYSDSIVLDVTWDLCAEIQFWAYSDENGNGMHDGGECFSAFSHDTTVSATDGSFGAIKATFRDK
jgi:hypothetical protein